MALAGTRDSISHLVKKIRTRQVSPITGALALRELMNVRTVSTSMINEVKSLCKETVVEESFALRQSCWLAVGNMLDALCDDNEDQLAVENKMTAEQLCPTNFKTQMVQVGINFLSFLSVLRPLLWLFDGAVRPFVGSGDISLSEFHQATHKAFQYSYEIDSILFEVISA